MIVNALTVDVEEWFQVGAFEGTINRRDWPTLESRVDRSCQTILDLFAEKGLFATFFVLGWIADRHPDLVRRIAAAGHEIASHGWDHSRVFQLTPAAFADDLAKTRLVLEQLSGQPVTGYRAPSFSIDVRTPWAHEILANADYAYSSSVSPIRHDHYGWPGAPRFAFRPVAGSRMIELPVTTARFAGRTLGAGGGGFFRLLPYRFTYWAVRRVDAEHQPAVFYFHPWELDEGQPKVADAPLRSRLRHYSGLGAMPGKLRRLLGDFSWGRMDATIAGLQ